MLRVLAYDDPTLLAALRTGALRRGSLAVHSFSTVDDLLDRALRIRPDVIVLVAGLVDPRRERTIARALRRELDASGTLLFLGVPPERKDVDEDLTLYDGLVALDDPQVDISRLLYPAPACRRRNLLRTKVRIPALFIDEQDRGADGVAVNISGAGAGFLLRRPPARRGPCAILFHRADGRSVTLGATPVWVEAISDGAVRAGVRFAGATLGAIRSLYDLAFWEVVAEGGDLVIHLHGEITEATNLDTLLDRVFVAPILDLGDVTRVNSAGALRWVDFLRSIPDSVTPRLRRLSVAVGRQMLICPAMTRRCIIESFFVPYECERCEAETQILSTPWTRPQRQSCSDCGGDLYVTEPIHTLARMHRAAE